MDPLMVERGPLNILGRQEQMSVSGEGVLHNWTLCNCLGVPVVQ